ncbi:alpha/beta fold hydrolase [Solimicrobium silvestre]|uniref:Alpha/beta hydrolase family n=1 Tax=Solimicrobium silvestre TaxID=2099400 RepID=A0A2S9H4M3_9BURK|nr:alpha/beta hydrolase [Solimicrobium silvestre]PRC94929.1 Alpha/beta hydrolase family [Solimicrobium silvestre]
MKKWLKRISLSLLALLMLLVVSGAAVEQFYRHKYKNEFPPLGKLIDIGGRKIQIDCRGTGSPTVVFESGMDNLGSLSWSTVQEEVSKTTRACSYSRAGIMWSDPSDGAQNSKKIAADLNAVLTKAGEKAPFVLVAHSLGGPYAITYTKYYGNQVAGLVLIDPTPPDYEERCKLITKVNTFKLGLEQDKWLNYLTWTGAFRFSDPVDVKDPVVTQMETAYLPVSFDAIYKEELAFTQTTAESGTLRNLGTRPLIVLTSMKAYPAAALDELGITQQQGLQKKALWKSLHDDEAAWSSVSEHRLFADAGHYIHHDEPKAVVSAIQWVVQKVRGKIVEASLETPSTTSVKE